MRIEILKLNILNIIINQESNLIAPKPKLTFTQEFKNSRINLNGFKKIFSL